jgi:hypothetical protein
MAAVVSKVNLFEKISAIRKITNGVKIQIGIPDVPPGFKRRIFNSEPPDSGRPGSKRI